MSDMISTTAKVKENNKKLIKNAFIELKQATKIMVAQKTGLSVATCNTLLNEMTRSGELAVLKEEKKSTGAGRPSKTYYLNQQFQLICCIRCFHQPDKEWITCELFDILGISVAQKDFSNKSIQYSHIEHTLQDLSKEYSGIKVICMGLVGCTDSDGNLHQCEVSALNGIPMGQNLERILHIPVIIDTEINLITYGLYQQLNDSSLQNIITLSFNNSKCTAAGIMINGQVLHGKNNSAGDTSILNSLPEAVSHSLFRTAAKASTEQTITKIICVIIQLLNPDIIILTGKDINLSVLGTLTDSCSHFVSEDLLPSFTYIQDTSDYYKTGLLETALRFNP